jgi:xanthine/CO dehydrogenase XdhC/CoxF family maturation factor
VRELRDILETFDAFAADEAGVLASVVRAEGSTYRRPGARMLALPDDTMVGLISGGCLEGDLLEHARTVRASGKPRLVRYDHSGEDDVMWGLGLGCAGAVDVWLERVDAARPGPLPALRRWLASRERGALAVALDGPQAGMLRTCDEHGLAGPLDAGEVDAVLAKALASGRGGRRPLAGADICIEVFTPPLRLAVFGAGPDAGPLVRAAAGLGWDVVVCDHRPAFAKPERFPEATVREVGIEHAVSEVGVDAGTHAVVMTHHFENDGRLVRALLATQVPYIGVLGPRRRTEDLLQGLADEGVAIGPLERARVFGPAGLDIGADAPEEIALAIAAEIRAVAARRDGGALRERTGPIHDPTP